MHRFWVPSSLLLFLAAPAVALAAPSAGPRFERLARQARATGSVEMTSEFTGNGRAGAVAVALRFDPGRRVRVRDGYVVLPVVGRMQAKVRPADSGEVCTANRTLDSIGLDYSSGESGVTLRLGTGPGDSGVPDPFSSSCGGPSLAGLGESIVMPSLRLRRLGKRINRLTMRFHAARQASSNGYDATVKSRATVSLRKRG